MKQLTVNDLKVLVERQIKKGNGNKKILISDDDEGNGYHRLLFGFTSDEDSVRELICSAYGVYDSDVENIEDLIILG